MVGVEDAVEDSGEGGEASTEGENQEAREKKWNGSNTMLEFRENL